MSSEDWRWFNGVITFGIGSIIGTIIALIHSKNVFSELLFTKSDISKAYRLLSIIIVLSIYCYVGAMILSVSFMAPKSTKYCQLSIILITWIYLFAKMFMYLAFIIRLYIVYSNPIYHYSVTKLIIISSIIITWTILLCVGASFSSKSDEYHGQKHYITYCTARTQSLGAIIMGLYDIVLSITSIIAFINPLAKVIKSSLDLNSDISKEQKDKLDRLVYVGTKYVILTSVASVSTFIFMLMIVFRMSWGGSYDWIINIICLILMTPYYDEKRYYKRLCCGTIKCSKWCLGYFCGYSEESIKLTAQISRSSAKLPEKTQEVDVNTPVSSTVDVTL